MSRYHFKHYEKPRDGETPPYAVFSVFTHGHKLLLNNARDRFAAVSIPLLQKHGLEDLHVSSGQLDPEKLEALLGSDDEDGKRRLQAYQDGVVNAQITLNAEQIAIVLYKFEGDLHLLNPEIEDAQWPKMDWKCADETVRQRGAYLMHYIPNPDVLGLMEAATEHIAASQLSVAQLGNSDPPSSSTSKGTSEGGGSTIVPLAREANG